MPFKSKGGQREYRKRRRVERTDAQRIKDNEKQREYVSKKRAERTDAERNKDNEKDIERDKEEGVINALRHKESKIMKSRESLIEEGAPN